MKTTCILAALLIPLLCHGQSPTPDIAKFMAAQQKLAEQKRVADESRAKELNQRERDKALFLALHRIHLMAIVRLYSFSENQTSAEIWKAHDIEFWEKAHDADGYWKAFDVTHLRPPEWRKGSKSITGIIEGKMPDRMRNGDEGAVDLYEIGHSKNDSRERIFTVSRQKAIDYLLSIPHDDSQKKKSPVGSSMEWNARSKERENAIPSGYQLLEGGNELK